MLKTIFTLLFLFQFSSIFAQKSYQIISLGTEYSASKINSAFQKADLCGFYFSSAKRKIIFSDGTIVELKKQSELPNISGACFTNYNPRLEADRWKITNTNHLIRIIPIKPTK